jgi:hypothetical protein
MQTTDNPQPTRTKGKSVKIPIHGNMEHNAGILLAIGGLAINWANNESVFLAMLQALLGGERLSSNVIWFSQRNTKARIALILRLCQARINDSALMTEIKSATKQFNGFTNVRNFYMHGTYGYDTEMYLSSITSISVSDEGEPLRPTTKPFDRATLNQLADTTIKLTELNRRLWAIVPRLESATGAQPVRPPQFPPLL